MVVFDLWAETGATASRTKQQRDIKIKQDRFKVISTGF
jgi:hypothetical protein